LLLKSRVLGEYSSKFLRFGPTPVFEAFWRFAAERQAIFFRRLAGAASPWTNDPILSQFKFTNVYRASDRVSQFLIREVIYNGEQSIREVFFRVVLFKLFNKIETWRLLANALVDPVSAATPLSRIRDILSGVRASGLKIYSGAYIMPSGTGVFQSERKYESHLRLIEHMLDRSAPERLAECKTMSQAFALLRSYPMLGDFLAYQYVIDLNYSEATDFSESEFVMPGPGAKSGIRKCFRQMDGMTESDLIKMVCDEQEHEFERLGIKFQYLPGRRLQYIDCQNLFCEIDKYSRVSHPEIQGQKGRIRIKQRFRPSSAPCSPWYPPKWGINKLFRNAGLGLHLLGSHERS
jgi:alpha-glutamyl/putrescinyl thymine pyrophosphorylase clade 1